MEEFLGKIKVYTDETKPSTGILGWTLKQYQGCEVYKPGTEETFNKLEDLVVGTEFEFFGFFGELIRMPIIAVDGRKADADNGSWGAYLDFDIDDRHCWVVSGAYNSAALKKIDFQK